MPLIETPTDLDKWMDPDLIPGPVVTFGAKGVAMSGIDGAELGRFETDFHRHRKCQVLLTMKGVLTCELDGGLWTVPPLSALWMPHDRLHKITASGTVECYVAFIDPAVASALPAKCCALTATPLLRELLIRSATFPLQYEEGGFESHLVALLLDELGQAPIGNLHLPMPGHPRLRKIADQIMRRPEDRGTLDAWAKRVGMSERTLARLLVQETGMSFGRWRQQLHLMLAVSWLGSGCPVQQVAGNLGYESASSFVNMFRKALGTTPARYIAEQRQR